VDVDRQRVLGVEPQFVAVRHHAVGGATGQVAQLVKTRREQRGVTAELVDQEACDQSLVVGFEDRDGAEQVRKEPAPVDVADHDDGDIRRPGQTHVRQIGCA
jgi:hypothetical protein